MDSEIPNYYDTLGGDTLINKVKRVCTSTLLFIPAFILSNCLMQTLIGFLSGLLKYNYKVSYNLVDITPRDWRHWNLKRELVIQFAGPALCLLAGLLLFNLLRKNTAFIRSFRLFAFWFVMCMVNMVLGNLLFAPLGIREEMPGLYRTFAIVGTWMHFDSVIMSVFSIASIVASIFWGMLVRNEVLRYSYSWKFISKPEGKHSIVLQVFLLPVVLGAYPLLLLCNANGIFSESFVLANMAIISIGMFMRNSTSKSSVRCSKDDVLNHIPFIELGLSIFAWLAVFRFFK